MSTQRKAVLIQCHIIPVGLSMHDNRNNMIIVQPGRAALGSLGPRHRRPRGALSLQIGFGTMLQGMAAKEDASGRVRTAADPTHSGMIPPSIIIVVVTRRVCLLVIRSKQTF